MLLAKGPILISILINFGTFAAASSSAPWMAKTKSKKKENRQKTPETLGHFSRRGLFVLVFSLGCSFC